MAETYKLVYFDFRALAEPIRWILNYKEIDYEDKRLNAVDWENIKKNHKWEQLPELHINGKTMITQSAAISRYLARKYDLIPSDNLEATRCDEIVEAVQDLRIRTVPFIKSKYFFPDGKDVELKKKLSEEDFPKFLKNLNDIIIETQSNSAREGNFIFGNRVCWADFWLAHYTSWWQDKVDLPALLIDYPKLKLQQEAVMTLPRIKMWIEARPQDNVI